MRPFLILNPRSGSDSPSADELREAAEKRGIQVHVLRQGDDLEAIAREAEADVLGMAGGDGSLATVASVAIERDIPFVCIPFGTRNHFARDIGLDRQDPIGGLDAFGGVERRIDVGRVGEHCTQLTIDDGRPSLRAAIDGEPARLETPLEFRVEPLALRLLVPRPPE